MKLYCFDFDDTVVSTDAKIRTSNGDSLTTAEYARKKSLVESALTAASFEEFANVDSCDIKAAPFLRTFARALLESSPVAIITARSNNARDFRRLVTRAAKLGGADDLHDKVHLYCCNANDWSFGGRTPEERKCIAILDFFSRYPDASAVGFSDDDRDNLCAVTELFAKLSVAYPHVKWRIFPCSFN